jgi:hypothetical protein
MLVLRTDSSFSFSLATRSRCISISSCVFWAAFSRSWAVFLVTSFSATAALSSSAA